MESYQSIGIVVGIIGIFGVVNVSWGQNIVTTAENATANAVEEAMAKAKNLINLASNMTTNATEEAMNATANATGTYVNPEPNSDLDMDTSTGYYPPPYSYNECLTVFTKEMCDFRFNR